MNGNVIQRFSREVLKKPRWFDHLSLAFCFHVCELHFNGERYAFVQQYDFVVAVGKTGQVKGCSSLRLAACDEIDCKKCFFAEKYLIEN